MLEKTSRRAGDGRDVAAMLERIDARLERLEQRIDAMASVADQAPAIVGTTTDIFDEWARERGDVDQRLRELVALLDRATEPKSLAALRHGLDLVVAAPDMVATFCDIADEVMMDAAERGVDISRLGHSLRDLALAVARMATVPHLPNIIEDVAGTPAIWHLISEARSAMLEAAHETTGSVGPMGMFKAMRDPRVKRSVSLFVQFAKRFGERIEKQDRPQLGSGEK